MGSDEARTNVLAFSLLKVLVRDFVRWSFGRCYVFRMYKGVFDDVTLFVPTG